MVFGTHKSTAANVLPTALNKYNASPFLSQSKVMISKKMLRPHNVKHTVRVLGIVASSPKATTIVSKKIIISLIV